MAHYLLITCLTAIACYATFSCVAGLIHVPKEHAKSTLSRVTATVLFAATVAIALVPLHTHPWALAALACSALASLFASVLLRGTERAAEAIKAAEGAAEANQLRNVGTAVSVALLVPWAALSVLASVAVFLAPL